MPLTAVTGNPLCMALTTDQLMVLTGSCTATTSLVAYPRPGRTDFNSPRELMKPSGTGHCTQCLTPMLLWSWPNPKSCLTYVALLEKFALKAPSYWLASWCLASFRLWRWGEVVLVILQANNLPPPLLSSSCLEAFKCLVRISLSRAA